jgi:hypothetical protein
MNMKLYLSVDENEIKGKNVLQARRQLFNASDKVVHSIADV